MKWFTSFLRRLLGLCDHDWKLVKQVKLNEFDEDDEDAIVSSKEYVMLRCTKCGNIRFRRL